MLLPHNEPGTNEEVNLTFVVINDLCRQKSKTGGDLPQISTPYRLHVLTPRNHFVHRGR
jgi:hypothetical protein